MLIKEHWGTENAPFLALFSAYQNEHIFSNNCKIFVT